MHDRTIGVSSANILAAGLMLVGLALLAANFYYSDTNDHLGFLSVPFICSACVARVRAMLCGLSRSMHDAFDLGREVGRTESVGDVRSLR